MNLNLKGCRSEMSYHLGFKIQAISQTSFDRINMIYKIEETD
jgi:hypothetical protein